MLKIQQKVLTRMQIEDVNPNLKQLQNSF